MSRLSLETDDLTNSENLLVQASYIAQKQEDGHLSIFRFTTGWKALFGTPCPDRMNGVELRAFLDSLPPFMNLKDALEYAIEHKPSFK